MRRGLAYINAQRVVVPRTRALEGGDHLGSPEIASKAPGVPNPDRLRRMRGSPPGDAGMSKSMPGYIASLRGGLPAKAHCGPYCHELPGRAGRIMERGVRPLCYGQVVAVAGGTSAPRTWRCCRVTVFAGGICEALPRSVCATSKGIAGYSLGCPAPRGHWTIGCSVRTCIVKLLVLLLPCFVGPRAQPANAATHTD